MATYPLVVYIFMVKHLGGFEIEPLKLDLLRYTL